MIGVFIVLELDGVLVKVDGIVMCMLFQSDLDVCNCINVGKLDYIDIYFSYVVQYVWFGFYGEIDMVVIEVLVICEDGLLVFFMLVGNNKIWLDLVKKVIIEVNEWQLVGVDGMYDIYYGMVLLLYCKLILLVYVNDCIGEMVLCCDLDKIVVVVCINGLDCNSLFSFIDSISEQIVVYLIEFLKYEVVCGCLLVNLLLLQLGVGNIFNVVLVGLGKSGFCDLSVFIEVIQDGMFDLLCDGVLSYVLCIGFVLSLQVNEMFKVNIDFYCECIIMWMQEIFNYFELVC